MLKPAAFGVGGGLCTLPSLSTSIPCRGKGSSKRQGRRGWELVKSGWVEGGRKAIIGLT